MKPSNDLVHAGIDLDEAGIATVTLHGAGELNILGTPAIADLRRAFERLSAQAGVRVVVLRGSGDKAFVAGADLKEMCALTPETARTFIDGLRGLCEAVRHCPVPVIARLAGWTLGAGLELAAACDVRLASNRAQFGMPEIKVGIPSVIHAALLPRLIGQARAGWLLLTGENIDAAQALSWALVDSVVALDRLDDEVARTAQQLASYGPNALRQQKRLLREWQGCDLDTAIDRSVGEFAAAFTTGEPARFMVQFLNRKSRGEGPPG
jgi:enoyl-CoA hydratase